MEIAVLGGGHGCYASAVDLTERQHRVRFWRRDTSALEALRETGAITVRDFKGERDVVVPVLARSLEEAVDGAELIVIPLPAISQKSLSEELAPLLCDGQVVYLPPGTFGSMIFAQAMAAAGNNSDVSFAEAGTLPYLARKQDSQRVVISGYATRLPSGVLPAKNSDFALRVIGAAYPVETCEDALSGALMNAGPIIHPPLIVMNAGPIEHFDSWDIHNEGTQPAIRRVTTALDNERIAVREALGYQAPHFPLADHYNTGPDSEEWMYGRAAHQELTDSGDWNEKIDLRTHRYMLEDTALGLSFLVSVGRWADVPTPTAQGLLSLASVVAERDLYLQGRTLESLGMSEYSREQMQEMLMNGPPRL